MESFQQYHVFRRIRAIIDFVKSLPDTFLKCQLTTKCEVIRRIVQNSFHIIISHIVQTQKSLFLRSGRVSVRALKHTLKKLTTCKCVVNLIKRSVYFDTNCWCIGMISTHLFSRQLIHVYALLLQIAKLYQIINKSNLYDHIPRTPFFLSFPLER